MCEACVCGALPVIVGSAREIAETFEWPGLGRPPWLFFDCWEAAAAGMALLWSDGEALNARQREVVRWWHEAVAFWRRTIASAVKSPR